MLAVGSGFILTRTVSVLLQEFAVKVYTYVTKIGLVVVLINVSDIALVPVFAALLIPETVALDQENVVDGVALDGVYENNDPLHTALGFLLELKIGEGFTDTDNVSNSEHPFAVIVKKYRVTMVFGVVSEMVSEIFPIPLLVAGIIPVTAFLFQTKLVPVVAEVGV
jgi:hypothetical protein